MLAGEAIVLDGRGVAFLPAHGALIVADLHLEKGSRAAAMRRPVPALDTLDTLARLAACMRDYCPRLVVCLGDSFHDAQAGLRLSHDDRKALQALCAEAPGWVWVSGNHDPRPPGGLGGEACEHLQLGDIRLAHIPEAGSPDVQIGGHYHPKARFKIGRQSVSGRCFVAGAQLLILPAFGAYAGGLSCLDPAITDLFPGKNYSCFMMFQTKLFHIS